eukprot:PhM_4_TR1869/c0_g1_i1/m.6984
MSFLSPCPPSYVLNNNNNNNNNNNTPPEQPATTYTSPTPGLPAPFLEVSIMGTDLGVLLSHIGATIENNTHAITNLNHRVTRLERHVLHYQHHSVKLILMRCSLSQLRVFFLKWLRFQCKQRNQRKFLPLLTQRTNNFLLQRCLLAWSKWQQLRFQRRCFLESTVTYLHQRSCLSLARRALRRWQTTVEVIHAFRPRNNQYHRNNNSAMIKNLVNSRGHSSFQVALGRTYLLRWYYYARACSVQRDQQSIAVMLLEKTCQRIAQKSFRLWSSLVTQHRRRDFRSDALLERVQFVHRRRTFFTWMKFYRAVRIRKSARQFQTKLSALVEDSAPSPSVRFPSVMVSHTVARQPQQQQQQQQDIRPIRLPQRHNEL